MERSLVLAERVELLEQRAAVTEAGCNRAQGYLFARPVDAAAFAAIVAAQDAPSA